MYTPPSFRIDDFDRLCDFIEENSFGILASFRDDQISTSHLPLLIDRKAAPHGEIIGHMAIANSHWKHLSDKDVLIIFHGPHAYISPTWYESKNVVPTWNYTAVHVSGTLRLTQDSDELLDIVKRYVLFYEQDMPNRWQLESADQAFIDQLLNGIIGFRLKITSMEGKFKLSQNHSPELRLRVIDALKSQPSDNQQKIAQLMQETLNESPKS